MSSVGPYDYYKSYVGYSDSGVDYDSNDMFYRRNDVRNDKGPVSPISPDSNSDYNDSSHDDKLDLEDYNHSRRRVPTSPVTEDFRYRGQGYNGEWKGNNAESKSYCNSPDNPKGNFEFKSGRPLSSVEATSSSSSDIYEINKLQRHQLQPSPYSIKLDVKKSNQQGPRNRTESAHIQNESFQSDISHVQTQKNGKRSEMGTDCTKENIPVNIQNQDFSLMREFLLEASADTLAMISFLSGVDRHIEEEADLEPKVGIKFFLNASCSSHSITCVFLW